MKAGGGVFIAADRKDISSVETELDTKCEILWCIKGCKPLYVGTFNRPPDTGIEELKKVEYTLPQFA